MVHSVPTPERRAISVVLQHAAKTIRVLKIAGVVRVEPDKKEGCGFGLDSLIWSMSKRVSQFLAWVQFIHSNGRLSLTDREDSFLAKLHLRVMSRSTLIWV